MAENFRKGVSEPCPEWKSNIWTWEMINDAIKGDAEVKRKNTRYLPMPSAMLENPPATSQQLNDDNLMYYFGGTSSSRSTVNFYMNRMYNPNYHTNLAYAAYKSRARMPEITGFTLRGLMGIATKNPPEYKLPKEMEYIADNATNEGKSLTGLYEDCLRKCLSIGRHIILADVDEKDDTVHIVQYGATSCINWKVPREKQETPYMVVMEEQDFKDKDGNEFTHETECIYKHLNSKSGTYTIEEIDESGAITKTAVAPSLKGKELEEIPIIFLGSINNVPDVDVAPLHGIAETAYDIYTLSADLRNSEFMSCNPTMIMTGVSTDSDEKPAATGPTVALMLENPEAKVYYTETDTSALNHVLGHIKSLFDQASMYGTQLLGPSQGVVEAAEALRIRQSAASATLSSVVNAVGNGIESMLKTIAVWHGLDPDKVMFKPNKEFVELSLTASEITALVNSWQRGAMSGPSMLNNFKKAGLLMEDDTIESEVERLLKQGIPPIVALQRVIRQTSGGEGQQRGEGGEGASPGGDTDMVYNPWGAGGVMNMDMGNNPGKIDDPVPDNANVDDATRDRT